MRSVLSSVTGGSSSTSCHSMMSRGSTTTLSAAMSLSSTTATTTNQVRSIHKGEFKVDTALKRRFNSHISAPIWSSQRFGGRWAAFRVKAPAKRAFVKKTFTQDPQIIQFQADVWNAQQTLRKKWKGRDFEVVELPFALAPAALRGVIPDIHTGAPRCTDELRGDYSNIQNKVFDREEVQQVMYSKAGEAQQQQPYPTLLKPTTSPMTLDNFL